MVRDDKNIALQLTRGRNFNEKTKGAKTNYIFSWFYDHGLHAMVNSAKLHPHPIIILYDYVIIIMMALYCT